MKGTLSQQLLQKGLTWDQLGLKHDITPSSESKPQQSQTIPSIATGKEANTMDISDFSKENKQKIHSYGKDTASSLSHHGQKHQSQLSTLVHSKTVVASETANLQATSQSISSALVTPHSLKEKVKVTNTITTPTCVKLASAQQASMQHRKDLLSDSIPKQQLQQHHHHHANIQIITDYTEANTNPTSSLNHHLHSSETSRLTTSQSELKQQYYNSNSTKHSESTPINPTQIYSSSPKAQYSVERKDTIDEITTDFTVSGSNSSQKINSSNANQSDKRFFLQLPKSKALLNQPAGINSGNTPKAEEPQIIFHEDSSKNSKFNQQSSQVKDQDATGKERIYSFQQTRANTAHNTPQNVNKNTQSMQQAQEFSAYSSSNSSSTKSQNLKSTEKTTPIHQNRSSISSQQMTHSHQRSLLNSYPFSGKTNPLPHTSSNNKPQSTVVEQLKQQHPPNSHHQIHTYSALHQQQMHSSDLASLQYEQFQRRSTTQTQFTFLTQPSQSSLQTYSIDSPHQKDYFSVSSLTSKQQNPNSHHKITGYSHKSSNIPHRDSELTSTPKTTTTNTTTSSQLFNHNSISKLLQFAPHSHQSPSILQWKYDIPATINGIQNTPVSAHSNPSSMSVSSKKHTNPVDSPHSFSKKKTYNKSCMNLNSKQLMTRTETASTLEDFDEYESAKRSQKIHKSNHTYGNIFPVNSQNYPIQSQQNAYMNIVSPSSEDAESAKKRGSYSNESMLMSPPKNSKENKQQFERILAALKTSQNPSLLSELTGLYSSIFNLQEGNQRQPADITPIQRASNSDTSSRIEVNSQVGNTADQQNIIHTSDSKNSLEAKQDFLASAAKCSNINSINHTQTCCPPSLDELQATKLAGNQDNAQQDDEDKEREEFLREEERIALQQSTLLSQYIDFSKEEFIKITREFYTHKNKPIPEHNSLKEQQCTISELLELQKWMSEQLVDRLDEEKKARLKTEEQTSLMLLNQEKTIKVMENKWNNQLEQLQKTKSLSVSGKNAENQLLTMHSGTLPTFNLQSS